MKKVILVIAAIAIVLTAAIHIIRGRSDNNESESRQINGANIPFSIRMLLSFAQRRTDMKRQYGKPDITRSNGKYSYEVRNMKDGSRLYVTYDSEMGIVRDIWRLKRLFSKDDFSKISPNKSSDRDVEKIDPYTIVFGDMKSGSGISEHRLKDNATLIIRYKGQNNSWVVEKIEYVKPDPSWFTSIILPEDLQ